MLCIRDTGSDEQAVCLQYVPAAGADWYERIFAAAEQAAEPLGVGRVEDILPGPALRALGVFDIDRFRELGRFAFSAAADIEDAASVESVAAGMRFAVLREQAVDHGFVP